MQAATVTPAAALLADAVTLCTEIPIARPPEAVFAFATNPFRWARWHPATHAVRGVSDRPLREGETVTEAIRAAGRAFDATWTVLACEPPRRWVIGTDSAHGEAWIEYTLQPDGHGTRFRRVLRFRSHRWPWRALDSTLMRWALNRQSARALARLRAVLEDSSAQV